MACRYMRVYNAAIKDRAFTYAIFFMFFFVHVVFCVWSAISPPLPFSNDWSHTGFMCAIKAFGSNTFVGVIFIIGACFWTLETLWSLWCLKMVRRPALHGPLHPSCARNLQLRTSHAHALLQHTLSGLAAFNMHNLHCSTVLCPHTCQLVAFMESLLMSLPLCPQVVSEGAAAAGVLCLSWEWRRAAPEAGGGRRHGPACSHARVLTGLSDVRGLASSSDGGEHVGAVEDEMPAVRLSSRCPGCRWWMLLRCRPIGQTVAAECRVLRVKRTEPESGLQRRPRLGRSK